MAVEGVGCRVQLPNQISPVYFRSLADGCVRFDGVTIGGMFNGSE